MRVVPDEAIVWGVEVGIIQADGSPMRNYDMIAVFKNMGEAAKFVKWYEVNHPGEGGRILPFELMQDCETAIEEVREEEATNENPN